MGVSKNGWFTRENPLKIYDLGILSFTEPHTLRQNRKKIESEGTATLFSVPARHRHCDSEIVFLSF